MADLHVIKTEKDEIREDVAEVFESLKSRIEQGDCVGLAYTAIFADNRSLTRASRSANRRDIIGAIVDLLFDFQRNSG